MRKPFFIALLLTIVIYMVYNTIQAENISIKEKNIVSIDTKIVELKKPIDTTTKKFELLKAERENRIKFLYEISK